MYHKRRGLPSSAAFFRAAQMSLLGIHATCSQRASPGCGLMSRCHSVNFSTGNVFADFSCAADALENRPRTARPSANRVVYMMVLLPDEVTARTERIGQAQTLTVKSRTQELLDLLRQHRALGTVLQALR